MSARTIRGQGDKGHAATEVLLKARLVREHWSLVISDVRKATEKKFHEGDFSSEAVEAAIAGAAVRA
ncbi:hypothetical protein [Streptomyces sp. N2A]|uniref:hypothetical protein n=1 Tax=Streptomyces sp. N2A TaxID=3073936 RepID=UPI0028704B81|nr:hypothetical protein [Streptomyces sp. N2A]